MRVVEVSPGDGPIVLGQPHGGTHVPDDILARLNANGRALADTDWHITRLYEGLLPGATVVRSNIHRYVIDANRDPTGRSLYPTLNTTGLVPETDFDGQAIWREGEVPDYADIEARRLAFHAPYHAALEAEMTRVRARHGAAVLFDCHSIRSVIPFLFDGELPVFNVGTSGGTTCAPVVEGVVTEAARAAPNLSSVLNGRFKGGWTTRHYGRPYEGWHAIQLELAQRTYMDETAPWDWREDRAASLRPHLAAILEALNSLALSGALFSSHGDAT